MTRFSNQPFKNKFLNALRGLKIQYTRQKSTKRQLFFTFLFVILAIYLKFTLSEFCMLGILTALIFLAELVNSTIEYIMDALFFDNYSDIAKDSKDMAAGIVLFAFIMSFTAGSFLYFPKILKLVLN